MKLVGRATPLASPALIHPGVWRVGRPDNDPGDLPVACLLADGQEPAAGYRLFLTWGPDIDIPAPALRLPANLAHLRQATSSASRPDGTAISVLWKSTAAHNSLLLTEQSDHDCLMRSQPPKEREDAWLFQRAKSVVSLLPPSARAGLRWRADPACGRSDRSPRALPQRRTLVSLHLLSNGRRFADPLRRSDMPQSASTTSWLASLCTLPKPACMTTSSRPEGAFEKQSAGSSTSRLWGRASRSASCPASHSAGSR